MTDIKILQHGEKATLFQDEENASSVSIEFTYYEAFFDDAELLYNTYSRIYEECKIKLQTENSNVSDNQVYSLAFLTLNTDKQGRSVLNSCLAKCLIGNALYPMAIQLPQNVGFINKIKLAVLLSILARFGNFTMPRNGE